MYIEGSRVYPRGSEEQVRLKMKEEEMRETVWDRLRGGSFEEGIGVDPF